MLFFSERSTFLDLVLFVGQYNRNSPTLLIGNKLISDRVKKRTSYSVFEKTVAILFKCL